jgi:thiamine-phosphate pyrophosphorylase
MLRYAITSRTVYPGNDHAQKAALLRQTSRWAVSGIDVIQLREKDLLAAEIAALARVMLQSIDAVNSSTKLLINSRLDIAIATEAHGVHLTAAPDELTPSQVRDLFASARRPAPLVTISCHTLEEVHRARENQVDAILFGPIFEKAVAGQVVSRGLGLNGLRDASIAAGDIPVYALGGVTLDNTSMCVEARAAGIAGIRLFHNGWDNT